MVDTTGPSAPSLSLSSATGNTYINGTTAYINAQAGKSGSFQAAATSTDNDSGLLKVNFPSPTGFSSGGGDSNSSPYQTTYNWSGAVAASGSQTTTAYNNANLTNTNTFTVTPDTTAPTGGALTVNGTNATGAGSTSYNSSGSWTIGTITDYTDSGSGLTSSVLTRQSATLSSSNGIAAGSCGSFGSATTIGSRATPIAQTLTGPTCYRYTLTGLDNVGNTVTITTTVMVDTTGPSAPSLSLSSATGNTYINGTTAYINAQAGKSGSFQAAATSTDNDSGLLKVNFPSPTGFSSGGGDSNSSPYQTTYNWSGAVAATGSQTTTAYNNANLTNTNTFTITPDTTAPTGGALTVNGTNATGAGSTSTTSNPGFTIGTRTNYTEASGSGLASSTLTVQSRDAHEQQQLWCRRVRRAVHIADDDCRDDQPGDHGGLLLPLHAHRDRQRRKRGEREHAREGSVRRHRLDGDQQGPHLHVYGHHRCHVHRERGRERRNVDREGDADRRDPRRREQHDRKHDHRDAGDRRPGRGRPGVGDHRSECIRKRGDVHGHARQRQQQDRHDHRDDRRQRCDLHGQLRGQLLSSR